MEDFNIKNNIIIKLDNINIYVHEYQIKSERNFIQNANISGNSYFTNNSIKATEIILKSKISEFYNYENIIIYFENACRNKKIFNFEINNLKIKSAYIKLYNIIKSENNSYLDAEIYFITQEALELLNN